MSQAIITRPDSPIHHPGGLRHQPVGVNFHSGSHYTALRLLEGYLRRDEINLVHIEGNRFAALERGDVVAAVLMEPYITLAEKLGYQVLCEGHYIGSDIASDALDAETFEAIQRAIRKAVDLINADKRKYLHYLIDDMPEQYRHLITPEDFHLPRLRYVYPRPYDPVEFERTREWMISWGLIAPDASYEELVDNRIGVSA